MHLRFTDDSGGKFFPMFFIRKKNSYTCNIATNYESRVRLIGRLGLFIIETNYKYLISFSDALTSAESQNPQGKPVTIILTMHRYFIKRNVILKIDCEIHRSNKLIMDVSPWIDI